MSKKINVDIFDENHENDPENKEVINTGDGDNLDDIFVKKEDEVESKLGDKPDDKNPELKIEEKELEEKKEDKPEEKKDDQPEEPEFKLDDNTDKIENPNKDKEYDYIKAAKALDLDIKENSYDEYINAVKTKIETSKKIVEPDLSKYDDETKKVVSFLEKGGTVKDIVEPLKKYDDFLLLSPEDKIKEVWKAEGKTAKQIEEDLNDIEFLETELREYYRDVEKLSKAQVSEKINEVIENDKVEETHRKLFSEMFNKEIKTLREQKYSEIVGDFDKKILSLQKKDEEQAQLERESLKSLVDKTSEYKGIKIPENVKTFIKSQIDTGDFNKFLNNAEAQLNAFLDLKFRSQIEDHLKKSVDDASRSGYNKGLDKKTQKLHNIPKGDTASMHDKISDRKTILEQEALSMEDGSK